MLQRQRRNDESEKKMNTNKCFELNSAGDFRLFRLCSMRDLKFFSCNKTNPNGPCTNIQFGCIEFMENSHSATFTTQKCDYFVSNWRIEIHNKINNNNKNSLNHNESSNIVNNNRRKENIIEFSRTQVYE